MSRVPGWLRRGFRSVVLAGARPGAEPAVVAARIRRIAVLRLDRRLGNQVILFPMLDALRERFPGSEIDVVAPGPYDAAHHGRRSVTRVVRLERSRPASGEGWPRLAWLRARRYDLVVDASHHHSFSVSSAWVTRLLGAPLRLGFRRGDSARVLNLLVDAQAAGGAARARVFFELARKLHPEARYRPPHWEVLPAEADAAGALRAALGIERPALGIHPGGRGARRWPTEHFIEVARRAAAAGWQPVVFLGPAESGQRKAWHAAAGERWRLVEAPPLRTLAAFVATLELWVSGDTGPLHLATSLGVPAVGVLRHPEALESLEENPLFQALYEPGTGPDVERVVRALALDAQR